MRTVHEPEPVKHIATSDLASTPGLPKKGPKIRLVNTKAPSTNGSSAAATAGPSAGPSSEASPATNNIQYVPARHPVTGQPGFMITYPADIHFSQFESEIPANQLMRLLRRQLHWATSENEELKAEIDDLERAREDEWMKKEAALHGVMSAEFGRGLELDAIPSGLQPAMEKDMEAFGEARWPGQVKWKKHPKGATDAKAEAAHGIDDAEDLASEDDLGKRASKAATWTTPAARPGHVEPPERDDSQEREAISALLGMSGF